MNTALASLFDTVRHEKRAALMPFMTAGLPDAATTVDLFAAMADAGADAFEVGLPYSDPLMDGPTIQAGSARALAAGVDLDAGLRVVEQVAARTGRPVVVMTYANPVFRVGPEVFARRAADAGAAGLIVADLPFDESAPVHEAATAAGLGMVLFVAPTSTEARIREVASARPAFIYGVADLGVTGERDRSSDHAAALAARVRAVTTVPLVMGVGISTSAQAAALAPSVDGIIVGSALVRRVLDAPDAATAIDGVRRLVGELADAVRGGTTVGSGS